MYLTAHGSRSRSPPPPPTEPYPHGSRSRSPPRAAAAVSHRSAHSSRSPPRATPYEAGEDPFEQAFGRIKNLSDARRLAVDIYNDTMDEYDPGPPARSIVKTLQDTEKMLNDRQADLQPTAAFFKNGPGAGSQLVRDDIALTDQLVENFMRKQDLMEGIATFKTNLQELKSEVSIRDSLLAGRKEGRYPVDDVAAYVGAINVELTHHQFAVSELEQVNDVIQDTKTARSLLRSNATQELKHFPVWTTVSAKIQEFSKKRECNTKVDSTLGEEDVDRQRDRDRVKTAKFRVQNSFARRLRLVEAKHIVEKTLSPLAAQALFNYVDMAIDIMMRVRWNSNIVWYAVLTPADVAYIHKELGPSTMPKAVVFERYTPVRITVMRERSTQRKAKNVAPAT